MIALDMKGAFDDRGTPPTSRDDKPRGTPLPCRVRDSSSDAAFGTGAKVTDCGDGQGDGTERPRRAGVDRRGAPSLQGVRWIGSAFHQGRESRAAPPPGVRLHPGHRLRPRGRAHPLGPVRARHRRARRRRDAAGRVVQPGRRHQAPATAACTPTAWTGCSRRGRPDATRRVQLLRQGPARATRRSTAPDPDQAAGQPLHRPRVPADPGPEPDLHGLVLAGHAGGRLHRERRRHARLQGGRLLHPGQRQRVGLARLQGRAQRRRQRSPTTAPPATSTSGTRAATRSTYTRSHCRRRPRPAASSPAWARASHPQTCLARRVRIGNRNIGRLKLGQGKKATARRAGPPLGRTSRKTRTYRYCVKKSKKGGRRRRVRPQGPDPDRGHQPRQPPLRQDQAGHAGQDPAQALRQAVAHAEHAPPAWCGPGGASWCSACARARSPTWPWPTGRSPARARPCAGT